MQPFMLACTPRKIPAACACVQHLGRIHAAAFSDALLHSELLGKASFWQQPSFYGIDMTPLHRPAVDGYFAQVLPAPSAATVKPASSSMKSAAGSGVPAAVAITLMPAPASACCGRPGGAARLSPFTPQLLVLYRLPECTFPFLHIHLGSGRKLDSPAPHIPIPAQPGSVFSAVAALLCQVVVGCV